MEHQEESGDHQPAPGGDQGPASSAGGPAAGEDAEMVEGLEESGQCPQWGRALPQVGVVFMSSNWASLLAGR